MTCTAMNKKINYFKILSNNLLITSFYNSFTSFYNEKEFPFSVEHTFGLLFNFLNFNSMNFQIISIAIILFGLMTNNGPKSTVHDSIATGIVFKSIDGGETWSDVSEGLPQKFDPRAVFADNTELLLGSENGIFRKRTSPESTWKKDQFMNEKVLRIFKSSTSEFIFSYETGIFQKIGNTGFWIPALYGLKDMFLMCVLETQNGDILVGTDKGMYKSIDKGKIWKKVFNHEIVYSLVENDNIILGGTNVGLIRSTNNGEHWENVLNEDEPTFIVKYIQGNFVAVSKGKKIGACAGQLPAGSANTLRHSNDGGKTWYHMDEYLTPYLYKHKISNNQSQVRKISDIEQYQNYIFTSIDKGVYRSADFGKTWELVLPSMENSHFDIAVSGNTIYAVKLFDGC